MKKAITYLGNSFALVLDKPICKMIGIGHGSIVKLSIEEGRLIIERTGESRTLLPNAAGLRRTPAPNMRDPHEPMIRMPNTEYTPAQLKKYSRGILGTLLDRGLSRFLDDVHYQRGFSPTVLLMKMSSLNVENADARDVVVLRRLFAIYDELEKGEEMLAAIQAARVRYPFETSAAMSAGSGDSAVTTPPSG